MEKRRSERISVHFNADFVLAEKTYTGFITDVSLDGVGSSITSVIEIQTDFIPVKILELSFQFPPGKKIHLRAEVAWFTRSGGNITLLRLGLKIIEPSPAYNEFIKSLYATKLRRLPKEQLITELLELRQRKTELETLLDNLKQSDIALQENEDIYRILIETADNSIYIVDRNYQYLFMNHKHLLSLGLTNYEYYKRAYSDFHTPAETDDFIRKVNEVCNAGESLYYENRSSRNGRYYLFTISPIKGPENRITALTVISKDITDRKLAEELLLNANQALEKQVRERTTDLLVLNEDLNREITERIKTEDALTKAAHDWRITFDSTKDIMLMVDNTSRIIKANKAASQFFEKPYTEIIGHGFFDLFVYIEIPRDSHPLEQVKRSRRHEESEIYVKDKDMWVLASADPIFDDSGEVTGAVHIIRDITEQKSLQLQLLQAQKMESIGRLAGGIAHDFNNLLSSIIGYTELILLKLPADSPFKDYMLTVKEAGEKAALLTQRLLAFSRKQVLQMQTVNLNTIIENMSKLLALMIREDIVLEVRTEPAIRLVSADTVQLEQVLMNLLLNARDAMPNGGKLIIRTANVLVEDDFIIRHENVKPGPYVLLSVSDTGIGMSKKIQDNLFEPFFTTKAVGEGTGLGLATVYGVVKQHNGHIYVYSEVGKGTTFKIYLPACDAKLEGTAQREQISLVGGTETVLVVDDDPSLRKLIKDILLPLGYRLLFASDGVEAMKIVSQSQEDIGLLLTDVIMPNMNGRELAGRFHEKYPEAKVIFMSGYTDETISKQGVLDPRNILIQKPFSPGILAIKLREILDSTA